MSPYDYNPFANVPANADPSWWDFTRGQPLALTKQQAAQQAAQQATQQSAQQVKPQTSSNSALSDGAEALGRYLGGSSTVESGGAMASGNTPALASVVNGSAPSGMEAVGTMADGSVMYAPAAEAGNMFGVVGGLGATAGLAGMGAYMYNRGNSLLGHSKDVQGDMGGSMNTAWKEAVNKPANALLAFNPVTGPAYWGLAAFNGLQHVSPDTRQRRRAQSVASEVAGGDNWYSSSIEGNPDVKQAWKSATEAAAPDFVGLDNNGIWVNNKFKNSRNEADLRPEDIWQSSQMLETFGNDWNSGKYTNKRREIAQALLDNKLIDEKKGGIYFQSGQSDRAKQIADSILGGTYSNPSIATGTTAIPKSINGNVRNQLQGIAGSAMGTSTAPNASAWSQAAKNDNNNISRSALGSLSNQGYLAVANDRNAGKKPGDEGYDWLYARAQRAAANRSK